MTLLQVEILVIAVLTAVACSLPGVFLVLRRMSLMSDAISHSILLGIVLAFFVVKDISSPLLVLAAAVTGVVTVALVELVARTRLVREDAAIGLVFPLFFSVGVILISRFATNVHLDTDAVLLGELAFAPFDRIVAAGYDLGPKSLWVMGGILVLNVIFVAVFYKELKVSIFDPQLAAASGFSPALLHYALMSLVSLTAVGAFDAVGAILVVALMIVPPATAYLVSDRLSLMLWSSVVVAVTSALVGYAVAHYLDASIAGAMATSAGAIFLVTFACAPKRGLLALARRRLRQRWEFAMTMLAIHLFNHEGLPEAASESAIDRIDRHLRWDPSFARDVVRRAERRGLVQTRERVLTLTDDGRRLARDAIVA